jgi:predicted alpha/beta hydrolase family esterase
LIKDGSVASSILILPGLNNSGPAHWQTRWEQRLPNARRVAERDWDRPDRAAWVAALDGAVAAAGPDVVLVAHSLGCLQVAHWASGAPSAGASVRGALLVAPPDPEAPGFPDVVTGFAPLPSTRLPFASTLVASTNDPYGAWAFAARCAEAWGSRLVNAGPLGHINADSGLGDWEAGLRLLEQL